MRKDRYSRKVAQTHIERIHTELLTGSLKHFGGKETVLGGGWHPDRQGEERFVNKLGLPVVPVACFVPTEIVRLANRLDQLHAKEDILAGVHAQVVGVDHEVSRQFAVH